MSDNESASSDDSSSEPLNDTTLRFNDCGFNPTILNSADPSQLLFNTCGAQYLSERQLRDKTKELEIDSFSIFHANIRSVNKNFEDLTFTLNEIQHKFHIIGLTETWLKSTPHSMLSIPGYKCEHKNRPMQNGGGVMLYVKDSLQYTIRPDIVSASGCFESIFLEIGTNTKKTIIIGLIYRPPGLAVSNFSEEMDEILNKLTTENKICYILGDLNINLLKSDSHNPTREFLDILYSHSFRPTVDKPTRITCISATLIDNIFTNSVDSHQAEIITSGLSDHLPIVLFGPSFVKVKNSNMFYWKRDTRDRNVSFMKREMDTIQWDEIVNTEDVNECYSRFVTKLNEVFDRYVPYKRFKCKKSVCNPWMTKGLLKSIRRKHKLYKCYLRNPNESNKRKYDKYRNKLTTVIREAKKIYFTASFDKEKGNIKQTWKMINNVLNKRSKKPPGSDSFLVNGTTVDDPRHIAEHFNDFFTNIGPNLASKIPDSRLNPTDFIEGDYPNSLFITPITKSELLKCIDGLSSNKSPGHDKLDSYLIKKTGTIIAGPLLKIFNLSLESGIVPHDFKKAKVIPLYKNGDPKLICNYRPISILPCLSKLLERLVANRLNTFITKYNILHNSQYGFRANFSTQTALIDLVDKISSSIDQCNHTIGLFLDLSKAFDTIDHVILLSKLERYGIRGKALDWFKSYLSDRKQFVHWKDYDSTSKTIKCGVP